MFRSKTLLFLAMAASLLCQGQVVSKVGCGEYGRYILRTSDGQVYEDFWIPPAVRLMPCNTAGKRIVDISGALYTAVGIDQDGYAWVFGQGSLTPTKITRDTTGAPFTGNISCAGYFGTYTTIRSDGSIWSWGDDAWGLTAGKKMSLPVKLQMPPGVSFQKIVAANILIALATNGDVYIYSGNGGKPVKIFLPGPATDVAGSHTGFYIAIVGGYPYGWGAEYTYLGCSSQITTPVALKTIWGLTSPISRIVCNHNAIHFIDIQGRLFGMGDNAEGDVGNGSELVNHAEIYKPPAYPAARMYAWSWAKYGMMISKPTQIAPGTFFKDIWTGNSFAFYHYAIDTHDSLYSWGRGKSWVQGESHNNEDIFPNAYDVLMPTPIHPFYVSDQAFGNFNPMTANAGIDQVITLNSALLVGKASASTGYSIISRNWQQLSGPPAVIVSAATDSTSITGLTTGILTFKYTATDNNTATVTDTVQISVSIPTNKPPVAVISPLLPITLPSDSIILDGTGSTDPDGAVTGYFWTVLSGPCGAVINHPGAPRAVLTAQQSGQYIVQLTVMDNQGATNSMTGPLLVNVADGIIKVTTIFLYRSGKTETHIQQ